MADIIDISDHLPPSNPEIVESLKVLTSEAQNGRVSSIIALWVDNQGDVHAAYHIETPVASLALGVLVDLEQIDQFIS
jgi:hypothetical protein